MKFFGLGKSPGSRIFLLSTFSLSTLYSPKANGLESFYSLLSPVYSLFAEGEWSRIFLLSTFSCLLSIGRRPMEDGEHGLNFLWPGYQSLVYVLAIIQSINQPLSMREISSSCCLSLPCCSSETSFRRVQAQAAGRIPGQNHVLYQRNVFDLAW